MSTRYVAALIHEEDGAFGVSFPDFPGCVASGRSVEDAIERGATTLSFHVQGMIEDGDPLPELCSMKEIVAREGGDIAAGASWARVPLDLPGRAVRINVSLEERLVEQIDRAARSNGMTRSGFLAEAAKARLRGAA